MQHTTVFLCNMHFHKSNSCFSACVLLFYMHLLVCLDLFVHQFAKFSQMPLNMTVFLIFMFNIIGVLYYGMTVRSHGSYQSFCLICIFTNLNVVLVHVFSFFYMHLLVCLLDLYVHHFAIFSLAITFFS